MQIYNMNRINDKENQNTKDSFVCNDTELRQMYPPS
jgi:hypothetical protein